MADAKDLIPLLQRTAPERIWLQVSDDGGDLGKPWPGGEVTWCEDSALDAEVPYVRADLAQPTQAAREPGVAQLETRLAVAEELAAEYAARLEAYQSMTAPAARQPKLPQVAILRASLNGFVIIAGRTALEELRRAIDAALAQEVKE